MEKLRVWEGVWVLGCVLGCVTLKAWYKATCDVEKQCDRRGGIEVSHLDSQRFNLCNIKSFLEALLNGKAALNKNQKLFNAWEENVFSQQHLLVWNTSPYWLGKVTPFIYANGVHSAAQQAVFHSLGCMRTWGQTEEPHTEQFAMDKEKLANQIFPIFNDCKRFFLAWGLGWHINVYCGCQKNSPFHFFVQITVIFRSQFLNLEPCLEPMILLKIFKRQFL